MVPTEEHIDILAPLVGNNSLPFLIELGMEFQIWEQISYRQNERDLVRLNKDILEEWRHKFCTIHTLKPTLRTIAQAFSHIGKSLKTVENTLSDLFWLLVLMIVIFIWLSFWMYIIKKNHILYIHILCFSFKMVNINALCIHCSPMQVYWKAAYLNLFSSFFMFCHFWHINFDCSSDMSVYFLLDCFWFTLIIVLNEYLRDM